MVIVDMRDMGRETCAFCDVPIYMINLDRDVYRLAKASERFDAFGVSFERIPAVDGSALSEAEKGRAVNRFRWWCAIGWPVRDGEIGCALSHYGIYRRMVEQDIPCAAVFEDDVIPLDGFPAQLEQCLRFVDCRRPQVVLLSNCTGRADPRHGVQPLENDERAFAYLITQAAAKALLKANFPMRVPCDHWGRWARRHLIELYHASPATCVFDDSLESNTAPAGTRTIADYHGFAWLFKKAMRALGLAIDALLPP